MQQQHQRRWDALSTEDKQDLVSVLRETASCRPADLNLRPSSTPPAPAQRKLPSAPKKSATPIRVHDFALGFGPFEDDVYHDAPAP